MNGIGRNDPCPCGSGKKYKRCCMQPVVETRPAAPSVADLLQRACELQRAGRFEAAEAGFRRILALESDHPDALRHLGLLAQQAGKGELALALMKRAADANPSSVVCHHHFGNFLLDQGKANEAVVYYAKAIALRPDSAEVHNDLGVALKELGEIDKAGACFRRAISLRPDYAAAHNNLGTALFALGRLDEAASSYAEAVALKPDYSEAYYNLGITLNARGEFDGASTCFRKALSLDPDYVEALNNLGIALGKLGRLDEAVASYNKALALKPDCAEAQNNLGTALGKLGRLDEAAASYTRALELNPHDAAAHNNLALVLYELGKTDEALDGYAKALTLQPDFAEAHYNLGTALNAMGRLDEAVACLTKAIVLKPQFVEAYANLGLTLYPLGRPEEAYTCFHRALELKPDFVLAYNNLLFTHAYLHDMSPESQLALAAGWEKTVLSECDRNAASARTYEFLPRRGGQLRLGIVSAELGQHAVAEFLEPVLEELDRSRLHITLFPTVLRSGPRAARLQGLADEWKPLAGIGDAEAVAQIRSKQIDVLIDTTGHTCGCRLGIFAHRAAPVQCHYIGNLVTTGLTEMDWFLGDADLLPSGCDADFRERIWRLPRLWIAYRGDTSLPESGWKPDESGVVWLGSFNNLKKVRQDACRLWAKVMNALPESKLLLKDRTTASGLVRQRILGEMAGRGIASERVEFAAHTPDWNAHMSMYDRLDIALDPIPLNSGTTAFDALWMGVPVVALEGDWMGGRMGCAILRALGKGEWVAQSEEDYVAAVVALARDIEGRKALRARQRALMANSPLCDARALARALEDAFEAMLEECATSRTNVRKMAAC